MLHLCTVENTQQLTNNYQPTSNTRFINTNTNEIKTNLTLYTEFINLSVLWVEVKLTAAATHFVQDLLPSRPNVAP
jgi:hypothetical protein